MKKIQLFSIVLFSLISLFLTGCDDGKTLPDINEGIFMDSPVEGLYYLTASLSGKTDAKGVFNYYDTDKTISFYIGKPQDQGVFIGVTTVKSKITLLDLSDTEHDVLDNEVTNMSRFFQSLDSDNNPNNGISIPSKVESVIKGKVVDFDTDPATFEKSVKKIFNELNTAKVFAQSRELKTPAQARRHLRESLGFTVDSATAQKLQGAMDKVLTKYPWPGIVMGVRFPDGKTWFGSKGIADIAANTPMTIDYKLRIGSVTKTFTATAILLLAQDGLLNLDDPVEKYLPGILGQYPYHDQITIRQLLNHTSGLDTYWHLSQDPDSFYAQEYYGDWTQEWDPRTLIEETIKKPPLFAPGTKWAYSNTGAILNAMVIEKITGKTYETVLTERLIDPLGLSNTLLPGNETIPPSYAHGYLDFTNLNGVYDPADDVTFMNPSFAWASGAIVTSIEDLLRWCTELNDGGLLNPYYQNERTKNMVNMLPDGSAKSGIGIMLVKGAMGHNGDIFGFQATVQRYKGVDFAVITNAQGLFNPEKQDIVMVSEDPSTGNIAYVTFLQAIQDLGLTSQ
ncbi:MAG: beta-lactamase family protein [Desulfobacterales bacterium]|nr:beta-lactamase family protein [Desulfobacterales bacterium]